MILTFLNFIRQFRHRKTQPEMLREPYNEHLIFLIHYRGYFIDVLYTLCHQEIERSGISLFKCLNGKQILYIVCKCLHGYICDGVVDIQHHLLIQMRYYSSGALFWACMHDFVTQPYFNDKYGCKMSPEVFYLSFFFKYFHLL